MPTGRRRCCAASGCSRTCSARRRRRRRRTFRRSTRARRRAARRCSVRERMEQHRKNPVCASCHAPMDPLGFALENFDAIGRWRATAKTGADRCVGSVARRDASSTGSPGLRAFLLERPRRVRAHGDREAADLRARPWARASRHARRSARIVRDAARDGYKWSSMILGVVNSTPFQMRRASHDHHQEGIDRGGQCCAVSARALALPLLDGMVPALTAQARTAARPVTVSASCICRTASAWSSGRRRVRGAASS